MPKPWASLGDADLVIEAATEDETVKRKIFVALCPFLKPNAIVSTNTSSISITRLAAATDRPERFIGLHFMNPAPVMELVEMIRGIATEDGTFGRTRDFVESLGKTVAVSEDFPAFMVNRILLPMINEAVYTLYEGVGTVDAIDTAMRLGAHHPMGPLQLADFIGLDTCLSIMQVLYEGLADSKYRPCPLLVKYVEAAGSDGRRSVASTTIAAKSRCRPARGFAGASPQAAKSRTFPFTPHQKPGTLASPWVPCASRSNRRQHLLLCQFARRGVARGWPEFTTTSCGCRWPITA